MPRVLVFLLIVLGNAETGFSDDFSFTTKIYQKWEVENYNEELKLEIKKDPKISQEYLRITLRKPEPYELTKDKRIDTAFKLISPLIKVVSGNAYYIRVKRKGTLDVPYNDMNKRWIYIGWYNMYDEEIGKTPLHGMGKKSESPSFFVDASFIALTKGEKARIVLGFDWPDFSEKDFLEIYEVKFEEYENRPFDFEKDSDLRWEVTFNHGNYLTMGMSDKGANGSKRCYRVERNRTGKADTAFRLASPYVPVKPDSFHILSFEERHNYDFSRVTKGYCQILWYDAQRNIIGKTPIGSLGKPHLDWFPWMKAFLKSPKGARLARVEFGNDWPDFKYGEFWEVDDVWLR